MKEPMATIVLARLLLVGVIELKIYHYRKP